MDTHEIGDVIANRRYRLLDQPEREIDVLIGRPRLTDDGHDWCCPYQIVGVGDESVRRCLGVDAFQSLQLVMTKAVPAWLKQLLEEHPSLRWEDAEAGDFGL